MAAQFFSPAYPLSWFCWIDFVSPFFVLLVLNHSDHCILLLDSKLFSTSSVFHEGHKTRSGKKKKKNPHWGWQIEREAENGTKEKTLTVTNTQSTDMKSPVIHLSVLYVHISHTIHYIHTTPSKRLALSHHNVSFPFRGSLPAFPLSSCPVWPPPAGAANVGLWDCNLEDRCETASYESVLMAPFIDSCLSNGSKCETLQRVPRAKWLHGEPACAVEKMCRGPYDAAE